MPEPEYEIDDRSLDQAYLNGLQDAWAAVNDLIKRGELPEPAHSERNGLVLATNAILTLMDRI